MVEVLCVRVWSTTPRHDLHGIMYLANGGILPALLGTMAHAEEAVALLQVGRSIFIAVCGPMGGGEKVARSSALLPLT